MISKFKKLGLATLALLGTSLAASAADMPVKGGPYYKAPPRAVVSYYNWTGFYAGINGGYSWGTSNWDLPVGVSNKPKGWMAGGTIGYNWQSGAIVYGLEGDFDWADVSASSTCAGVFTCTTKERWFATARGRIGYAFDRWLPYVTGGAAFGDVKASITGLGGSLSGSDTMIGWTVGGGLEYAFLGNWTAKVEYLYADLGKFNCSSCVAGLVTDNVSFTQNIVRAGLNYKFSGPIFSRY